MTRHVALLYSVVLDQSRRVRGDDLTDIARAVGALPVRTVLSTGNLILDSDQDAGLLEKALERAILQRLGKRIPVFLCSAEDWCALVAANPFPEATRHDPSRVAVRILREDPAPAVLSRIAKAVAPGEAFAATDRALWLASPDLLSTSPLARAIGARWVGEGTFRNASALGKILAALDV